MRKTVLILIYASLLFLAHNVSATVLDWSTVTWTAGSLSNTYDVDGDSKNDITISISGDTSAFVSGYPTATGSGLQLTVDFTDTTQALTVTVTFLNDYATAKDVNFSLGNLDSQQLGFSSKNRYVDGISQISATGDSGIIAPTISGSGVTIAGSGTNQTITGNPDGGGSATVNYGTNYLNSFTYTFGNDASVIANDPAQQNFYFGNVNFKKTIPEYGTTFCPLVLCGLFPVLKFLRQRKRLPFCKSKTPNRKRRFRVF